MTRTVVIIPLLLLTACESEEERATRHHQMCLSYGAKPSTPEYINCRATIVMAEHIKQQEQAAQAANTAAINNAIILNSTRMGR